MNGANASGYLFLRTGRRLILSCHQLASQHLAHRRFRDLAHEHVFARAFEVDEVGTAAVRVQAFERHRVAALDESRNLDRYASPQLPLIATAVAAVVVLVIADVVLMRPQGLFGRPLK